MSLSGGLSGFILVPQRRKPTIANLTPSGPITITANGQIVENRLITAATGHGFNSDGFSGVILRNSQISFSDASTSAAHGINVASSPDILIEGVICDYNGHNLTGANTNKKHNCINVSASPGAIITRVRLKRGGSGIYLTAGSHNATLSFIEGHDFRGPKPRGQLVQANNSDNGTLDDFSCINIIGTSFPEDLINFFNTVGWRVSRGFLDGNDSTNGVACMVENPDLRTTDFVGTDIDAINQYNGYFYTYPAFTVTYLRCRAKSQLCGDQGRGVCSSCNPNGLIFGSVSSSTNIKLDACIYDSSSLCSPLNLLWDASTYTLNDKADAIFTARSPIVNTFFWE